MTLTIPDSIRRVFVERFRQEPLLVRAPGRINLIGEHTDYNMGFVLPAAIDRHIFVGISLSDSEKCTLVALDLNEEHEFSTDDLQKTNSWADYIIGVFCEIQKEVSELAGFNMVISGDIPLGAGLSSSAALECAACLALSHVYRLDLNRLQIVKIGLNAERTFVGLDCGIMDQYASVFGERDKVLLIDCMNETHRYFRLELVNHQLLLVNSMVTHDLADSAYNERRRQCEQGVDIVKRKYGHVRSLREVSIDMINQVSSDMGEVAYRRCSYVIRENERVLEMTGLLENHLLNEAGSLLYDAHEDLRMNYEVTCKETDFLVDAARKSGMVKGARQMGGGFGGCTINLLPDEHAAEFSEYISEEYRQRFNKVPELINVSIAEGASRIS